MSRFSHHVVHSVTSQGKLQVVHVKAVTAVPSLQDADPALQQYSTEMMRWDDMAEGSSGSEGGGPTQREPLSQLYGCGNRGADGMGSRQSSSFAGDPAAGTRNALTTVPTSGRYVVFQIDGAADEFVVPMQDALKSSMLESALEDEDGDRVEVPLGSVSPIAVECLVRFLRMSASSAASCASHLRTPLRQHVRQNAWFGSEYAAIVAKWAANASQLLAVRDALHVGLMLCMDEHFIRLCAAYIASELVEATVEGSGFRVIAFMEADGRFGHDQWLEVMPFLPFPVQRMVVARLPREFRPNGERPEGVNVFLPDDLSVMNGRIQGWGVDLVLEWRLLHPGPTPDASPCSLAADRARVREIKDGKLAMAHPTHGALMSGKRANKSDQLPSGLTVFSVQCPLSSERLVCLSVRLPQLAHVKDASIVDVAAPLIDLCRTVAPSDLPRCVFPLAIIFEHETIHVIMPPYPCFYSPSAQWQDGSGRAQYRRELRQLQRHHLTEVAATLDALHERGFALHGLSFDHVFLNSLDRPVILLDLHVSRLTDNDSCLVLQSDHVGLASVSELPTLFIGGAGPSLSAESGGTSSSDEASGSSTLSARRRPHDPALLAELRGGFGQREPKRVAMQPPTFLVRQRGHHVESKGAELRVDRAPLEPSVPHRQSHVAMARRLLQAFSARANCEEILLGVLSRAAAAHQYVPLAALLGKLLPAVEADPTALGTALEGLGLDPAAVRELLPNEDADREVVLSEDEH